MTTTVVDASIIAAWLLPDEDGSAAEALLIQAEAGMRLTAPWLFWAELRNILIVNERRGRIPVPAAESFLAALRGLSITLDTMPTEASVLDLARRHRLSVHDALYLDLALRLECPLATLDARLREAHTAEKGMAGA